MEILYLIGNGFDLNLQLPTSFNHFCKFYQKIENKSESIKRIKEDIKSDIQSWADLELRLGMYMKNFDTYEEFEEIYDDLLKELGDYLKNIEENVNWALVDSQKFKKYLCNPEESLTQRDIRTIRQFKANFSNLKWNVHVVTYNYTRSFEKLLEENYKKQVIGFHHNSSEIILRDVHHIHGYIDDGMVVGINDISQLNNKKFHDDRKVLNTLIKSNNNRIQGHTIEEILEQRISQAHLICLFGSSIGDTDNIWWEKIGKKLVTSDCYLIIYTKANVKIDGRFKYKKGQWEETMKERFKTRTQLSDKEKEIIDTKIIVRSDTDMFKDVLIKPVEGTTSGNSR